MSVQCAKCARLHTHCVLVALLPGVASLPNGSARARLLQALLGQGQKVDSLQRIGGGGNASNGPDLKQVVDRLDKLIRETKALGQTGVIP